MPRQRTWKPTPHAAPISSTSRVAYPPLPFVRPPSAIVPQMQSKPWEEADDWSLFATTSRQSYKQSSEFIPPSPIRPKPGFDWTGNAMNGGRVPRSTSQDSFQPVATSATKLALEPCKPRPKWASVPHAITPTSTMRAMHCAHPSRSPPAPVIKTEHDIFQGRPGPLPKSTSQDSFQPYRGRAPKPIRPRDNGLIYAYGEEAPVSFDTTSRSSFVPHPRGLYMAVFPPADE